MVAEEVEVRSAIHLSLDRLDAVDVALVGKQLPPRIRALGKITLYRTSAKGDVLTRYPRAGPLLTRRLNTDLIVSMWDDLLRVAASVQGGHATAALVVGKLCSSKRQENALTSAIKESGRCAAPCTRPVTSLTRPYPRRIARQLNKGENLHALRRSLAYAGEGAIRRRHLEQQTEQMWCLTLATNAIVCWPTEYHGLAVGALRAGRRRGPRPHLAHPPRQRALLWHLLRRHRWRTRPTRRRRLPAPAAARTRTRTRTRTRRQSLNQVSSRPSAPAAIHRWMVFSKRDASTCRCDRHHINLALRSIFTKSNGLIAH
ncbi:Tn3 family transposase [Micromonospora aurantiaca (nom. illeg.)]|uniref:Tn3 family transposase n=1 Tax=Micromonospora aurantiaca (nom. illeg.) TaxID=47850 RepID=UPI00340AADF2